MIPNQWYIILESKEVKKGDLSASHAWARKSSPGAMAKVSYL